MAKVYFLLLFISNCLLTQETKSIVIGQKLNLESKVLSEEKELFISLPYKYEERIHNYPVIYVLEAEFLFEPTVTIAKMMAARSKMPQSIIVGLANMEYKKRYELGYKKWQGKPERYLKYFQNELIPYIEKNYRANKHRTIIGLSPTTGFVMEAFLQGNALFKGYIALSAHLEWDRIKGVKLIDELIKKSVSVSELTLYLGRADSDLMEDKQAKNAFEDATKKLKGKNVNIKIDVLKNEEHYLMSLSGLRNGFATIYPNSLWRNPGWIGWDKTKNYAKSYFKDYYDLLSEKYGFDIYPVEDSHAHGYSLSGKAYNAFKWGTSQQAIDLLELGLKLLPKIS